MEGEMEEAAVVHGQVMAACDEASGSVADFVTVRGNKKMPVIAISMTMWHLSIRRFIQAMLHGARHFELPINDKVVWGALTKCLKQCLHSNKKTFEAHQKQDFFLSTTVSAYNKGGAKVKDLMNSFPPLKMNMKRIDIIYLENPVGLRGTDIRKIFKTPKNDMHITRKSVRKMFDRNPDTGMLNLPTKIQQNLWLLWKRLERERQHNSLHLGNVKLFGLRNFSSPQIEALVRVAKHQPDVVQAEINAYNMQFELQKLCKDYNIQVIAIHPFGNPNDVEREGSPLLCNHPTVKKVATELKVHPKVVLLRYLLQLGIPFMYDICEYKPRTLFKEIWSITLSSDHMKALGALNGTSHQEAKTELNKWLEKDPLWPFYIVPRKRKKNRVLD